MTIHELEQQLVRAHAARVSNKRIVKDLSAIELSETLTEKSLRRLSQNQSSAVRDALQLLADESAFLNTPPEEIEAAAPMPIDEQRRLLAKASDYVAGYARGLPDFRCRRITQRLDDDPARQAAEAVALLSDADTLAWRMQAAGALTHRLTERDEQVEEVSFRDGQDSNRLLRTVNVQRDMSGVLPPMQGLTTSGEFGGFLRSLFAEETQASFRWLHWEDSLSGHAAALTFEVERNRSEFFVLWCCVNDSLRRERVGYTGQLYLDPETGAVLHFWWKAKSIPQDIPTRDSATSVNYGGVQIGAKTWQVPVHSVTITQTRNQNAPNGSNLYVQSLNQVEFKDYHKFETDSRIVR